MTAAVRGMSNGNMIFLPDFFGVKRRQHVLTAQGRGIEIQQLLIYLVLGIYSVNENYRRIYSDDLVNCLNLIKYCFVET